LPTVTFEAERLTSTVAPASAAKDEGGIGTQTSSQISTAKVSGACARPVCAANSSCAPKGTVWPHSVTSVASAWPPGLNWRAS
jgi:hypothetical protein